MSYAIQLTAAFIGSMGFAMLFNIRGDKLISCAFGGLVSWSVCLGLGCFIEGEVVRFFIASMVLTLYAEIMARVRKSPDTIYIICAAIPLFPGGSLYNTMHLAAEGRWEEFSQTGMHTLLLAAAIAVGVICMMTLMHVIFSLFKDLKQLKRTRKVKKKR